MGETEINGDWIGERWARIPVELLTDQRLTLRHIKVLLALALSRNEKTYRCNPSREALADLSGIHISHISRVTRDLSEFGWVSKVGNGRNNMRSNYQLLNPTTITRADSAPPARADSAPLARADSAPPARADSAPLARADSAPLARADSAPLARADSAPSARADSAPPARADSAPLARADSAPLARADSAPPARADSAPSARADSARRKEQQKEQQKEQYAGAILADLGVSENIIKDFILLRKQKRAPITPTAIEGIKREAIKAGCSFNDAIRTCCERGWAGFKAEWLLKKGHEYQTGKLAKPWFMIWDSIEKKGLECDPPITLKSCEYLRHVLKEKVFKAYKITPEMTREAAARDE